MTRLLIVDDEESLYRLLADAFRKSGNAVDVVTNGPAAQKKLRTQAYSAQWRQQRKESNNATRWRRRATLPIRNEFLGRAGKRL